MLPEVGRGGHGGGPSEPSWRLRSARADGIDCAAERVARAAPETGDGTSRFHEPLGDAEASFLATLASESKEIVTPRDAYEVLGKANPPGTAWSAWSARAGRTRMIRDAEIRRIAGAVGVEPRIVELDYPPGWALRGIADHESLSRRLVFKGGT